MRQPVRHRVRLKHLKASGTWPSGNPRIYYRTPKGEKDIPLPDAPQDSPKFLSAYAKAAKGINAMNPHVQHRTGTIGAGCRAFLASDVFLTRAPSTRQVWRRTIEDIERRYSTGRLADLQPKHIRQDLAGFAPHPANNRLKVWRAMGRFWVDAGLVEDDPARPVRPRQTPKSDGFAPWTDDDVQAFRAHWPVGSMQRLAFEIMARTGAAIGDACILGPGHVDRDGWLTYTRQKCGTTATVPFTCPAPNWMPPTPDLPACLAAAPRHMTFLTTAYGGARSQKATRQWFARAARTAGLGPGKTAHGIRKWLAVAMAENGASPEQRMAILGHDTIRQTRAYSKTADARRIISGTESVNFPNQLTKQGRK